ncbi:hypothetical protein HPB50_009597 [Hyalomma asiaticum]|uniref:Uncharacterized protein n=1 Tax=Hyalomma asiaticum TaxID=266040 RepID=A0ACB7SDK7_HYAAI|nr:hypothetical protein HPB50_009597 [Hyalomma asiaticum]
MAWTKYQVILALMLVFTGSINTLATKSCGDSARLITRVPCHTDDELPSPTACGSDVVATALTQVATFDLAVGMFLGELSCLLAFRIVFFYYTRKAKAGEAVELPPSVTGSRDFNPLIFLPPAMCDLVGTSIMYIGLNLTYASSFQMLRGAVIIFTGLLSVAFLGRRLRTYEWIGILTVMCGLVVVGLSDILFPDSHATKGPNSIITGDLLIVLAQVITASQMVIEEKFVTKYKVAPLQAVGWEGSPTVNTVLCEIGALTALAAGSACPTCRERKIAVREAAEKRKGLSAFLELCCENPDYPESMLSSTHTSRRIISARDQGTSVRYDSGSSRDSFAVNVKAVLAARTVDAGHDQLSQFARFSDFRARCTTAFNGISKKLHGATMKAVSQNFERGRTVAAQQRELMLRTPTARAVKDKVIVLEASRHLCCI